MHFHIEYEQEVDGRWIAEVPEIPGVLTYGESTEDAMERAKILTLSVLAEWIEAGKHRL
ncbi:type II toxin-antitoxin system HicB family antitoxin [Thiocystis violacea]|uniref:type II toxin-antitoxin system HicB family antitoxin n=1 Tax=Thiocystis violacea TaxID=13725 RepID=UPI0019033AE1|nr:type II toxin-antitoxin system HicB family antitoxin [Thiocystis violacea]MBK1719266.1 HicB family protein [Thiocystis violacea]